MNRKVAQALLGAAMLAALAGCAYQDPLALPDLDPPAQSRQQPYAGYSPYYGSGYNYNYSYGSGYDPYYSHYYGGDPRYHGYYAPGVVYVPYPRYVPVPCADVNQDGRCDKHNGVERPPRPRDDVPGDGPRVRRSEVDRYTAPGMTPRIVPRAPASARPAPVPSQLPSQLPAQARSPEPPRRAAPPPDRGPRVSPGRPAAASDDRSASRPTPEP
jgi:predicted small lipoprotein YifL